MSYPIWSNSIGCFDIEHLQYDRYVYIAGDSTAWGYTPFDEKFGTLLERMTGKQILKCGVTHTGQRHQLEKLVEIVDTIGILPETILVTYSSNDIVNDYAHPHTTVVSGWQINSVTLDDNNQLHRRSYKNLQDKFDTRVRRLRETRKPDGWLDRAKAVIKRFSLTAQLANLVIKKVTSGMTADACASNESRKGLYDNLYCLPQDADGKQWYLDNPFAHQNRVALLEFKSFAEKNDVRLIVVLMPLKKAATVREKYYAQVRIFLESNNIEFIDPAFSLVRKGMVWSDLFWTRDTHLNPAGNKVIAHILLEEALPVFQ
jgi:lysophospholipase L1-like esterase